MFPTASIDDRTNESPPILAPLSLTASNPPSPPPIFEQKGSVEDLTDWQARSAKKYPNQMGAGHVYVKLKGKAT